MKKSIFFLLITCLLVSPPMIANQNDKLGKLMTFFTTSSERNKLDQMRKTGKFDKGPGVTGSSVGIIREPTKVEFKGLMVREKGKPVVWINEGNTLKSNKINQQISVKTRFIKKDQLKVPVKVSQKKISLKPGQQWSEMDNKVKDKYQTK